MKAIVFLLVCASIPGFSPKLVTLGDDTGNLGFPEWSVLEHTFQEIFTGSPLGPYSAKIAQKAQLAMGDSLLDLRSVLTSGRIGLLGADAGRPPTVIRRKMNAERNAAFVLLRTQLQAQVNQHTVVFMKDSTGTWMIESWHTSQ